jgi:hypothetical protein
VCEARGAISGNCYALGGFCDVLAFGRSCGLHYRFEHASRREGPVPCPLFAADSQITSLYIQVYVFTFLTTYIHSKFLFSEAYTFLFVRQAKSVPGYDMLLPVYSSIFDNLNMLSDAGESSRQSQECPIQITAKKKGAIRTRDLSMLVFCRLQSLGKVASTIHYTDCTLFDDNQS